MSLDLFLARMKQIVYDEKRPFSYKDFLSFDYEGKTYRFEHGTIRNYFSKLRKPGKIELVFISSEAFYTVTGVNVGKVITPNHTVVSSSSHPVLNHSQKRYLHFLLHVPMDEPGIHDVILTFRVKGLWQVIRMNPNSIVKNMDVGSNRDITLKEYYVGDGIYINTTVHKTDTITVRIACTLTPVPLNLLGLSKITDGLGTIEDWLRGPIDDYLYSDLKPDILSSSLICKGPIPKPMTWTAKMWHFGQDSLTCYNGEMFGISWGDALGMFHIYSKVFENKNKVRIRKEIQEYPNKPWIAAFMEKMKLIDEKGPNYFNNEFNEFFGGLGRL